MPFQSIGSSRVVQPEDPCRTLAICRLAFCWIFSAITVLGAGCGRSVEAVRTPEPATEHVATGDQAEPKLRKFAFTYGSTITDLEPGEIARVWLPVATDSHEQKVTLQTVDVPSPHRETKEKRFGNSLIYFECEADESGQVRMELQYVVERREARRVDAEPHVGTVQEAFITSSSLVPVDGTLRKQLFGDQAIQGESLDVAHQIYDAVGRRMSYGKPAGLPWGRGDAVWACDARVGNCSDFHSLFIGVARDLQIPARFEIGFPIPETIGRGEVGGYHCWARFLVDGRWIPVDISEANKHPELHEYYFGNLTADRVRFTIGRDLELDPPQQAGPVNFLVYPYVEVEGRQHTSMVNHFTYADRFLPCKMRAPCADLGSGSSNFNRRREESCHQGERNSGGD